MWIFPPTNVQAGHGRDQDRLGSGSSGLVDILPQIVLEIRGRIDHGLAVLRVAVVVAKLHEDVIALGSQCLFPKPLGDEALGAPARLGMVEYGHAGVEELTEYLAPTGQVGAVLGRVGVGGHRGIAD